MEVQGVDSKQNDKFPYSGLRVLGSVQTGVGVFCVLLGAFDLALTLIPRDQERALYNVNPLTEVTYETIVTLTIASCPLWCGMWFVITGSIGTCVSRMRSHSLLFFRNTFLTLSVLCAAVFSPACLGVAAYEALLRHELLPSDYRWLIPLLVAFLAVLELVLAIVSAAMCCCCSSVQLTKVHVLFASQPNRQDRPQEVFRIEVKTPRTRTPELPKERPATPKPVEKPEPKEYRSRPPPSHEYQGRQSPEPEYHGRQLPPEIPRRPVMSEDSYAKLKKWAIPSSSYH